MPYRPVASLEDVQRQQMLTVSVEGQVLLLVHHQGQVFALDNRCPHMGFPLDRGSVHNGILTCHWHHARFDLCSGGTFDLWADDVPAFPVQVSDGQVWVDLSRRESPIAHQRRRLRDGLERNLSLVIAKAVITLVDDAEDPVEPLAMGLDFGTRYRMAGWGQGLTILTCMANLLPSLAPEDRARALYHGLAATAADTQGHPSRFPVPPLPQVGTDMATLKTWFRQFVEVRDPEGAERCVVSALRAGGDAWDLADMLFSAATDHRYIDVGHPLDFVNKALEALDQVGWEQAEPVLTSLVRNIAMATRMEEANAWRHPVDLVAILETAFQHLGAAVEKGRPHRGTWNGWDTLIPVLLDREPQAIVDHLLAALAAGATEEELAAAVAYAAALRIARFHTSNEFRDWDTALHTFTYANAVHQGLRRLAARPAPAGYPLLLRGVFDAAMSIYLDRFLNIPAARLPEGPQAEGVSPETILEELPGLLDRQQQVDSVGQQVAAYLLGGGDPTRLRAVLGHLLLREDRDFHTIQCVEAAFRQHTLLAAQPHRRQAAVHVLVAAARYLAAHAPTARAQGQTFRIARRLHRHEALFEE